MGSQIRRGRLRIYLGPAAGVGKTYAMLGDARIARADGTDLVIGYLEPHGRSRTEDQAESLERAPLLSESGRRAEVEVDVGWILSRQPTVVCIDELAHTNASVSAHRKRYEDVQELLDAGIDVWTTVNIQHLESLNNRIRELTGVDVQETFPDRFLHGADEIRLIDLSPIALRERINQGLVYSAEKVENALSTFFTVRNLTALRALALHELAENAAAQLAELDPTAEARPNERILCAVGGRRDSLERVIRAGARLARRSQGELFVVFVKTPGTTVDTETERSIEAAQQLTRLLGGAFLERENDDPAREILEEAQAQRATQIVLGATGRSRMRSMLSPSPIDTIMREAHGIDLHIVTRPSWTTDVVTEENR